MSKTLLIYEYYHLPREVQDLIDSTGVYNDDEIYLLETKVPLCYLSQGVQGVSSYIETLGLEVPDVLQVGPEEFLRNNIDDKVALSMLSGVGASYGDVEDYDYLVLDKYT